MSLRARVHRLSLALVVAGAAAAQKSPGGAIVAGELGAKIEQTVAKSCPMLWGVVLVANGGELVFAKGYGLADRAETAMTPASLFDLGTSSQQLTIITALRLAAMKKLAPGDPIRTHVADWPADRAAITVQHLMDHTSGLSAAVPWGDNGKASARNALAAIARTPQAAPAGTTAAYAPVNANLLALVLESAAQTRFERLVVERTCRPAGMATAQPLGQRAGKNVTSRLASGGGRPEPADRAAYDWSQRGASGVLASALDVHALLSALTSGKLLGDDQLALLWRPFAGGDAYGVTAVPLNGETIVRVHGTADGYRVRWLVDRTSRSCIVVLADGQVPLEPLELALAAELWQVGAAPAAPGRTVPAPAADPAGGAAAQPSWTAAEIERFAGTYTLPRGGGTFTIERCAEGLRLLGAGLQASVRVSDGTWPPAPPPAEERLRAAEDRGLRVLERLLGTDASVERDAFVSPAVGATARRELRAWADKHGKPRVEYVGTSGEPAESWFVVAGDERASLRATWAADGRLTRCVFADAPPPFAAMLSPVRADVATATTAAGRGLVVTIEGRGTARRLVFEDTSPGSAGLLECELSPGR